MVAAEREGYRVLAPGEPAAAPWMTFPGKTVLVLAQHPQAVTRLLFDVLPSLLTDPRITVVWATPDLEYRWSDGASRLSPGAIDQLPQVIVGC